MAASGAYAGWVSYWDEPVYVSDAFTVHPDRSLLTDRFLYHVLKSKQDLLHSRKTGGGVPHVRSRDIADLFVPVPSLRVQQNVVNILQQFEDLEVALETELAARRRQYAFYRDTLLSADARAGTTSYSLGELATVVRGASPRPIKQFIVEDGGVPWIKIGDTDPNSKYITSTEERVSVEGAAKSRRIEVGDFLLSNSMSFGRPYISKIEGYIHDGWLALSDFEEKLQSDFLYHLLRSSAVQAEFARRAGDGTIKNLNADIVRSTRVSIPSLSEQTGIVEILDKFDLLVNDLSIGLPAELAVRRKQYEYYRDRLLTFEEPLS